MSAVIFDPAVFRAMFPAFADEAKYPDAVLDMYFAQASCYIDPEDSRYLPLNGACLQQALYLLVAHIAYLNTQIAAGQTPGITVGATIDKINVSLATPPSPDSWAWWLNLSPYGQQLQALLQAVSVGGFYTAGWPERSSFRRSGGGFP